MRAHSPQSSDTKSQSDICLVAHVITCALYPQTPASSESKFHVDSLACALLTFLDEMPQLDATSALAQLAFALGTQHPLTRHVQVVLSGWHHACS
jgi:hypothetical protein